MGVKREIISGVALVEKPPLPYTPPTIRPQAIAAIAVSLGSLVVGFSTSYTSPALESMSQTTSRLAITKQQGSWIGSLLPLFALLGGMIGGPLIDNMGRKKVIFFCAFPFIAAFIMIAAAINIAMVMVGRAMAGLSVGILSLALPVYLGETIDPSVRGVLGLFPTTFGNLGVLISYSAGMFLNWSRLAMLGAVLPIPFLFAMLLIPETPRWYMSKNNMKACKKAVKWLRADAGDVSNEVNHIACDKSLVINRHIGDVFSKIYIRPILISLGLMFFQQMSGINAVIFYSVTIFHDSGSIIDANLSAIILGIVNVVSTLIATLLIDKLGRKILLYISAISMIITLGGLGWFFNMKQNDQILHSAGWVPLVCLVLYIVGFSTGFGPIPWLMMGEILPGRIRGTAASIITSFNWACTFLVTKTFTDLVHYLGPHGAFWLFAGFCLNGLLFSCFLVPETKGKSLEEIEKIFIPEKVQPQES